MDTAVKVTTTFRIDKEIIDILKEKAKAANRSLNNYVECLLKEKVDGFSNTEFEKKIAESEKAYNEGRYTKVNSVDDFDKMVDSL